MDEYTRNKMPPEVVGRIEERRREFNAAWDQEEVRQKILAAETRALECVNALAGIPDPAATMKEVVDVLTDLETYFDNRADVMDGDYGVPEPNAEMQHLTAVQSVLAQLGRG